ncbi:type IX secretion system membrane protein PorP/SprF [Litoribacter alkaliphilus]|uniref:Type IX secretion system membrane protein PorP/SprF n=1 Tax=Litoribacter ruber TaxID=702568 RepID=A0AAP2G4M1_9BACT|nr:type IX secretion system membrane protein PorP/SprF [Litoribacter alkaliphilus]MBS9523583.1 type IX secretion system membrane protein PorP/SprF [Litoribacter alkaliphilus]
MEKIFRIIAVFGLLGLIFSQQTQGQQLPQFSQYIFNGLHINPGYAGYKGEPYVQSTYRSQWMDFPGAPRTFTVTADLSANEGRMGFGASILSDRLGPSQTSGALLTYAYRLQTGYDSFLGFGVSAGVTEYVIDGSIFNPNDHGDIHVPEGRNNMFAPNMNAGVFWHNSKYYAGLSAFNLVGRQALEREDLALAYHNFHFYFTAGALFPVSEQVQFKPSFLIKEETGGAPTSYDLNGMFLFMERLWLGASYRSNLDLGSEQLQANLNRRNAVAFIVEFFALSNLRLGYAYDHNTNVLNNYRNNSHELSVGYYVTPRNVRMKNPRWF